MSKNPKALPTVHARLDRSTRASNSPLTPALSEEPRKKRRVASGSHISQRSRDEQEHKVEPSNVENSDNDKNDGNHHDVVSGETTEEEWPDQGSSSGPREFPGDDGLFTTINRADQLGSQNGDGPSSYTNLDVPPEITEIVLNFRKGRPPCVATASQLEKSKHLRQIKDWSSVLVQYRRGDGFHVFLGHVKSKITDLKRKSGKDKDLQWFDTETPYIQPTHSTRQTKYSALTPENFEIKIARAYHAELLREKASERRFSIQVHVYVYLKHGSEGNRTLKPPSRIGIEGPNRKISEARAEERHQLGDISQAMYSRQLASSSETNFDRPIPPPPPLPLPPPTNPLYRQPSHLESRTAAPEQQGPATNRESGDIVQVKVRMADWVTVEIDLTEIRRALGLDLSRMGGTTRDSTPPPPVPEPAVDMLAKVIRMISHQSQL